MPTELLVSFLSTNYSALKNHWQQHSVLSEEGKRGSDKPFKEEMGGKVALLDWDNKELVWEMDIDSPSGMVREGNELYVNSINSGKILKIDFNEKEVVAEINNPNFNKPHSLVRTTKGFLVASTGLDSILEVDTQGNSLFEYSFVDHGYNKDQFGNTRVIDKGINHQTIIYPSLTHTTHVNFARYKDNKEEEILATLFHPGELVSIDKRSGNLMVLLSNLNHPHNVNDFPGGKYLVSDTDNDKALVIDVNTYNKTQEFAGDYSWIQDAVATNDRVFIADADNHRVVSVTLENKNQDVFDFSQDYRIFQILPL